MLKKGTIGSRIKELRILRGLTQEKLAEILCTKKSVISYYEHDRIDMKKSVIEDLAKALETTYEYLACGIASNFALEGRLAEVVQLYSQMDDLTQEILLKQMRAVVN